MSNRTLALILIIVALIPPTIYAISGGEFVRGGALVGVYMTSLISVILTAHFLPTDHLTNGTSRKL